VYFFITLAFVLRAHHVRVQEAVDGVHDHLLGIIQVADVEHDARARDRRDLNLLPRVHVQLEGTEHIAEVAADTLAAENECVGGPTLGVTGGILDTHGLGGALTAEKLHLVVGAVVLRDKPNSEQVHYLLVAPRL
jgi:hypothetical protein